MKVLMPPTALLDFASLRNYREIYYGFVTAQNHRKLDKQDIIQGFDINDDPTISCQRFERERRDESGSGKMRFELVVSRFNEAHDRIFN